MNIDFQELANKYQTPYYVYDFDYITKQYGELKSAFRARKSLIAYAVKANSNITFCLAKLDLNNNRAMCGTAIPTKPIGPQKAVTTPEDTAAESKAKLRVRLTFKPDNLAISSPNMSKSKEPEIKTDKTATNKKTTTKTRSHKESHQENFVYSFVP